VTSKWATSSECKPDGSNWRPGQRHHLTAVRLIYRSTWAAHVHDADQGIAILIKPDADNPQAFRSDRRSRIAAGSATPTCQRTASQRTRLAQLIDLATETGWTPTTEPPRSSSRTGAVHADAHHQRGSDQQHTTLVSDATLTVPLDETGTYRFYGRIYYDGSTAGDFKLAFTFPAVAANGAKWGMLGRLATTATSIEAAVATAPRPWPRPATASHCTFVDFDGFLTITATGNLVAQYAQNTLDATNLTIQFGSWLEVVKVG
jgi:hypothetical protein